MNTELHARQIERQQYQYIRFLVDGEISTVIFAASFYPPLRVLPCIGVGRFRWEITHYIKIVCVLGDGLNVAAV